MNIPQGGETSLWIILLAALFFVVILLVAVFLVLRGTKKKNTEPEQGLAIPHDTGMAASFQSALDVLRSRVTGGSFQYRVPWILLIGTPGSGKTSILECLASAALPTRRDQPRDDKGIAWGFLNNGVLIDVPGSLLLGPGQGIASNENGWNQLLRRLNRHRPARPLDGVVLTVGADDLLDTKTDLTARGGLIRAKLDQLQSAIGLVLPVYVVITRCDTIRGFGAYCAAIDRIDPDLKKEIFGWSNNHTLESVFTWVWVDEAMNAVGRTLRRHQLGFFGAAQPLEAGDDLYLFPPALNALRDPLHTLLTQLFVPVSYRDTHYFRGVYFCGLDPETEGPQPDAALVVSRGPGRSRLSLAFLSQLFEKKVFVEKALARPIAQEFFFRNRVVVCAQVFAALFALVMFTGLMVEGKRLNDDKNHRILPVIRDVESTLQWQLVQKNGSVKAEYKDASISSAYDVLTLLAGLKASGFSSPFFMPASRNDPIEGRMEEVLAEGFQGVVLNAFQTELEKKYPLVVADSGEESWVLPTPVAHTSLADTGELLQDPRMNLVPEDNRRYRSLRVFLAQLALLESHIQLYDKLSRAGSGNITDVRELLHYLSGRSLPSDDKYRNLYFTRAIGNSKWPPMNQLERQRKSAADRTALSLSEFFGQWFGQSPLRQKVLALASDISGVERNGSESPAGLRRISQEIVAIDRIFGGDSLEWLQRPFTLHSYQALAPLDDTALGPVFKAGFRDQEDSEGREAWYGLRAKLLSEQTSHSGPILELDDTGRIALANPVRALGSNLRYLSDLDFMAAAGLQPSPVPPPQTPVSWNGDMLAEALKLNASFEKYQREVLPTVPGGSKDRIQSIAQVGLAASMTDLVARAQTTMAGNRSGDEDALTLELNNFDQCLDKLKQLQALGERLGRPVGSPLIASLGLYRRAGFLLTAINSRVSADSLYSWQRDGARKWNGSTPLSQVLYQADSSEALSDAVAADHERLRVLVQSATPLVQLLSDGGLPVGDSRQSVYWGKLGADFKQFGDKKPGNPITMLETFLEKDLDKIVPENRCQSAPADLRTGDPFVNSFNSLRTEAVHACLRLVRERFNGLAENFTQHLAGRFPFSADASEPVDADPADVSDFFDLLNQNGTGLSEALDRLGSADPGSRAKAQEAIAFLKKIYLLQPLFATADKTSLPALDVSVQFRSNQNREAGGNQIIDWDLKIGDQLVQYRTAPKPVRWHYGDQVTLTLRYAKDSPSVPVARDTQNDVQIADRKITYDYRKSWSLLALLRRHAATSNDFDNPTAPVPNTVRLTFGNAAAMPGTGGAHLADTVVFVTLGLQSPAAKDAAPKEGAARNAVVASAFPASAPLIP